MGKSWRAQRDLEQSVGGGVGLAGQGTLCRKKWKSCGIAPAVDATLSCSSLGGV